MFIRKKPNKSGVVSIQIIDKSSGKYKVVKTIGSAKDWQQIKQLETEARNFLIGNQLKLFKAPEETAVENFLQGLSNSQIHTIGPELIFGTLFDRIGFDAIPEELFRHIVVARLVYPTSKLKTVDYLYRYKGVSVEIQRIYRFLDRLNKKHKETAEKIAYEYTERTLKNISVVFYDMTTLYFESEDEDDLRKIGFSKDGKFQNPQIMLGLLVGQSGYPIGYDIFEGNTYEGHTLIPTLKSIQKKYGFPKPIVVADAGLLSKDNIEKLKEEKYQFILGARIKNESELIKKEILKKALGLEDGQNFQIKKADATTLMVGYSDKRKRKDEYNRKKGVEKLKQKIKFGKLTKASINNRGYNKFLSLTGEIEVMMDEEKIKADESWDGLKGYVTNTTLKPEEVMENYRHLWQIEKAFRISKTDLKIRPIYHFVRRRIESHICIAFVAYTIYKELERLLEKHKAGFSPKRAAELTQNMYQLEYTQPDTDEIKKIILKMSAEQETLRKVVCDN